MTDLVLRRPAALLIALLAAAGLAVGGLAVAAAADPATTLTDPYVPPPDTIVQVLGDAANGFEIQHYDGSWLYPPTDSEIMAECEEYDRPRRQFRCKVSNRTWLRDLADLSETTTYYRSW